jgi:hypothetical protein
MVVAGRRRPLADFLGLTGVHDTYFRPLPPDVTQSGPWFWAAPLVTVGRWVRWRQHHEGAM